MKTKKIQSEFIDYLKKYIEDNLEEKLIEIDNIKQYYRTIDDITYIVYMLLLNTQEPNIYKFTYIAPKLEKQILSRDELVIEMKKIINENRKVLLEDFNKEDWEYRRNIFFIKNIKTVDRATIQTSHFKGI